MTTGRARPSPWIALAALLAAPVGSAIVATLVFYVGGEVAGYRPLVEWPNLPNSALVFAIVFLPLGGPLIVLFWKRAPFSLIPCSMFGAAFGALVGYLCVLGLGLPDEDYPGVVAVIGMSLVGGVGGGLTFGQICRLGSRIRHDP